MKRTAGGTAVLARRAPQVVASDTDQEAVYRRLDFFPTPLWAARAGAELVMGLDPEARTVWEPACGGGHMAEALSEYFEVTASDVYPHGYGQVRDFLSDEPAPDVDWIITNPPFKIAEAFVTAGLLRVRRGVALLLRLPFLESERRHSLLYGETPLAMCAPFSERVPMRLGKWDLSVSSATAYAWFVWRKGWNGPAQLQAIPPGTRDRLWRDSDVERFGWRPPAPLFGETAE